MKKAITAMLVLAMIILSGVSAFATDSNEGISYEIGNMTITFEEDTPLTLEQQQKAAMLIAEYENNGGMPTIMPYAVSCPDGHAVTVSYSYGRVHKVRALAPRCNRARYAVTSCTVCDFLSVDRVSDFVQIDCCPEE